MKIKLKNLIIFFVTVSLLLGSLSTCVEASERNGIHDDLTLKSKEITLDFIEALAFWDLKKLESVTDKNLYTILLPEKEILQASDEEKKLLNSLSTDDITNVFIYNDTIVVSLHILGTVTNVHIDMKSMKVIDFMTEQLPKFTSIDQNEESLLEDYLKSSYLAINLSEKNDGLLKYFGSDLLNNEIFLTGEAHGTVKNNDLDLLFLKFFNEHAQVRYYLKEISYAQGQLFNKFLETGDRKILHDIYKRCKGTFEYNQEAYEKWIKLYEYNKTLPLDKKIKVIGIDVAHQGITSYEYLIEILPNDAPPSKIKNNINLLKNKKFDKYTLANNLKKDLDTYPNEYKKYLGSHYFDFTFVVDNLLNAEKFYASRLHEIRESAINENFVKIYNHLPKGKYYGQWGMAHVYQTKNEDVDGELFAEFISKDFLPTKSKVLSIKYIYKDSYGRDGNDMHFKIDEAYETESISRIMENISTCDLSIFKLNKERSPFKEKPYLIPNPLGGVTIDYIQYAVMVKDSKAATTYEKNKEES